VSAHDPDMTVRAERHQAWQAGYQFGRAEAQRIAGAPVASTEGQSLFAWSKLDARGWAYHLERVEEGHYGTE